MRLALYSQIRSIRTPCGDDVHLFTRREDAIGDYDKVRGDQPPFVAVAHAKTRSVGKVDMERYHQAGVGKLN